MATNVITKGVAGPFKAWYTGPGSPATPTQLTLGVIGSRGIRMIRRFEGEDIAVDALGDSIVDSVYMGGQMFLEFELEEANKPACMILQNPFQVSTITSPPAEIFDNEVGIPGTFVTSKAGSLVLSPLYNVTGNLGTTAGGQATPVLTFGLITLAMGFDMEKLFASKRRVIPIRLRCYPYSDAGSPAKYIWFSQATLAAASSIADVYRIGNSDET